MSATVEGLEAVTAKLDNINTRFLHGGAEGQYKWSNENMADSHDECPYEAHTMQRSGIVSEPEILSPTEAQTRSHYNTVYAVRQHESMGYHHQHGKAKFFEDPTNRNKGKLLAETGKGAWNALEEAL